MNKNRADFIFFSKNCNFDFTDEHKFITINEFEGFDSGIVTNTCPTSMFVKIKSTGVNKLGKFNKIISEYLQDSVSIRFIKLYTDDKYSKDMICILNELYGFDIYEYTYDNGVILKLNDTI